jgi:hypothetical protein
MSVEKVSRLRSKVEELRSVRKKIVDEIRERQHKLEEIDGVRRCESNLQDQDAGRSTTTLKMALASSMRKLH